MILLSPVLQTKATDRHSAGGGADLGDPAGLPPHVRTLAGVCSAGTARPNGMPTSTSLAWLPRGDQTSHTVARGSKSKFPGQPGTSSWSLLCQAQHILLVTANH